MKNSTINHFIAVAEGFLSWQCRAADFCWNALPMEILHCQQQHSTDHKDPTSKDPTLVLSHLSLVVHKTPIFISLWSTEPHQAIKICILFIIIIKTLAIR